ncbi:hypothetical protein [Duganella vulcania]|uniref:Uncharacterized protein n=1 Tax=Duganella vulcania TaxID=2692166 RepID=A0A845GJ38_9BURK|nr:hypothetical protein [Duganella vulcania]MYM92669.1 hypothetical protein [Duganella vulcania]
MYVLDTYKRFDGRPYRVLVLRMTSPDQVLASGQGSLHQVLADTGLDSTVGLYFYRFERLDDAAPAFTKIGVTSRVDGIGMRKKRGWIYAPSAADSYRKPTTAGADKGVYVDVQKVSAQQPMYFVYYELSVEGAFPQLEEMVAFYKHDQHFGRSTNNVERVNTHPTLGRKIVWYDPAFEDVLRLVLPSGQPYPGMPSAPGAATSEFRPLTVEGTLMHTIARFVPPSGDKHWSFQMRSDELPDAGAFIAAMRAPIVKAVEPFLQGHSRDWAMVEFWTRDEGAARAAAEALAQHFGCTLRVGDFSREELGLA